MVSFPGVQSGIQGRPVFDTGQLSVMQHARGGQSSGPTIISSMYSDAEAKRLVEERYRDDQREFLKHPFEKQWLLNIAMFQGHQHVVWDDQFRSLREPRTPSWRVRMTANHIWGLVHRSVALMTQTRIPWKVLPTSTDKEDQDAARVGQVCLEHFARVLNLDELRIDAEFWAQCAGTVFLKTHWDPDEGADEKIYLDPQSKQPIPEYFLQQSPQLKAALEAMGSFVEYRPGGPRIDVVNPFRVYVDPFNANYSEIEWMMEVAEKALTYFYQRWPEKARNVRPNKSFNLSQGYERRLLHMNGIMGVAGYTEGRGYGAQTSFMRELFMAPYHDGKNYYRHGRHIIYAGGEILVNTDNPYHRAGFPGHGFPYEPLYFSKIPGRFWGSSHVEHQIPLQRAYNMVRSKVIEAFKMMGMPKWVVPYQADIKASAINNRPGEIIEYDVLKTQGVPPQQVQPVGLPPQYQDIQGRSLSDMQAIASQPEALQGIAPPGVRSGVGVKFLAEAAMRAMNPLIMTRECAWGRVGGKLLRLIGQNMSDERILKIYGRDGVLEVMKFKGADLRGNYDVIVPQGSMVPQSKAEVYEIVMAMAQSGVINPIQNPQDRQAVLRLTRFAEDEEWFRSEEADRRRARNENDMMSNLVNPQFPRARYFDNHGIHKYEHDLFRKSDAYERMAPVQKAAFDAHVKQHETALQEAQQAQMQAMAAMKGTPGRKGVASAPRQQPLQNLQGAMT